MYYPLSSGLILFFLFSLFHHLPCASSNQGLDWCGTPFQCGNISAGFPFWGANRSKDCGHPLLELHCNKINITSLFISKQEYSVLNIGQTSNTLTLAKQDLQGSFCSSVFTNTTLPSEIFQLSPTYKSVTVFYHCSSLLPDLPSYTCPEIGPISVSVNPRKYPETCRSSFTLKVPTSFVTKEKELNVTNLESVLRKGFEVKVAVNENACQECLSSHGRCHGLNENLIPGCGPPSDSEGTCGYNQTSNKFVCYCKDPYSLSCRSTKSDRRWIIGGVLILIFIVFLGSCSLIGVIALLLCPCFRVQIFRRRKTSDERRQEKLKALIPLKHYTYKQVKKITKSFAQVVGRGGFGIVYRGTLSNGRMVAVKVLKESKGNNGEDFINEVASMSQTSHVNIVTLLGFCSEGSKRAIIYEFLGNGSLDKFISDKTSMNLDLTKLYGIALGVARGLEYLHYGCKTRIVHFDIKPQNVLLDDNLFPKVSDFGLAKLCEKKESVLSLLDTRGTIGYIAPEMISRVYGSVSHKSDVYSYGMLVLDMIGARKKERFDQHSSSNASSMYFPEWIYKDLEKADIGDIEKTDNEGLIKNEISREEEEIEKKITLVGLWCIQPSPSNRPTMNRVVEMMEGSLEALEVPPRPVLQQIPAAPLSESLWISEENSSASEILEYQNL